MTSIIIYRFFQAQRSIKQELKESLLSILQRKLATMYFNVIQIQQLYLIQQLIKMGQGDSKVSVKEGELEKFGKVEYLISEQPDQSVKMRVNIQVNKEESDIQQWRQEVQKLKTQGQISQLLVLPLQIKQNNCLVCTHTNQKSFLTIYYQKINLSLFQVIKNRRYFKKYFTQNEIWYLLYVLVKVASYFEERNDHVGNIHTTNVLLNDKNRIRIFTLYSSPSQLQNLTRIKQSRHMDTFIAPEEIRFIHEDSFACINDCNRNKVDLFNIGLVLISTIMLKDCYHFYNRTLFELNEEKLKANIQEMRKTHINVRYSANLLNLVQAFLTVDSVVRKTPKYYYEILRKNEAKILELQKFQMQIPSINEKSNTVSPQVIRYLQSTSPNTRQSKFLSLTKNKLQKKLQKQHDTVLVSEVKNNEGKQQKLTRKLFNE